MSTTTLTRKFGIHLSRKLREAARTGEGLPQATPQELPPATLERRQRERRERAGRRGGGR